MSNTHPSGMAVAVTPSDTVELVPTNVSSNKVWPRAIYVGVAGDVTVKFDGGPVTVLFKNVAAGTWIPIRPALVMATDTTATNIIAIY